MVCAVLPVNTFSSVCYSAHLRIHQGQGSKRIVALMHRINSGLLDYIIYRYRHGEVVSLESGSGSGIVVSV